MKIAIFGLGYVGLTAAVCLAKQGHHVMGIDVNETKTAEINAGISPIVEPGLAELLEEALQGGQLYCATQIGDRLSECALALVCVGTPSAPDGSHNMAHIAEVSRQIALNVSHGRREPLTVAYRSTIRPGTTEELIEPIFRSMLGDEFDKVDLVYNPEFLRESVSIKDYFSPPKIVIGTRDAQRNAVMDEINENINAPVFYVNYREAEITKFVDNSFHALKVSFANELGRLCNTLGISAAKMHEIFVSDTKLNISPYYLRPGGAFGGSCLPKDVRALQHLAGMMGATTPIIDALIRSNESHKRFLFEYCTRGLARGASILLVGLAFKSESDDLRESPHVDLARMLLQAGYRISIVDPGLDPKKLVGQNLGYAYSHLPTIGSLLISAAIASEKTFDLVIDGNGTAGAMTLSAHRTLNIHTLP